MPKAKLDYAYVLTAWCEPDANRTIHWDTHLPGHTLEMRPNGTGTFIFRYTNQQGRQRQVRVGAWGLITPEQARKKAAKLRAEVELGGDPAAKKQEVRGVPLYGTLAEQHLAFAKSYLRNPKDVERLLDCHILPRWAKTRVDELNSRDIAIWLASLRDRYAPATIEKIRITLNRSFELALKWETPGVTKNPVRHIPRPKYNNARERYLTEQEAARLLQATARSSNTQLKNIVGLLLLTGARKTELLQAKWEHVDLERRSWHIPTTKTGKPRHVPLSQAAMDILNGLPCWDKCPWLIPNPETRLPYTDIKRAWDTARDEAGLSGLRLHDLRHSAASFLIHAGIDLYVVGRILGHADHQSTQRYAHCSPGLLMQAVEAGAAKINLNWSTAP